MVVQIDVCEANMQYFQRVDILESGMKSSSRINLTPIKLKALLLQYREY